MDCLKQVEQDDKMFKNIELDHFWTVWKLSPAVNLLSSQTMVTGEAS
jgi:hypothetical protein